MGTPSTNTNTTIYQVYDQERIDLGNKTGAITLDMGTYANMIFTLTGNVTLVSTSNDLPAAKGSTYTIFVVQDSTPRTINWLGTSKFVSTFSASELQPDTAAGSVTMYEAIWNGTEYELLTDKPI